MDYLDDERVLSSLTDMRAKYQNLYDPRFKLTYDDYVTILDGFNDSAYRSVGAGGYRNTLQLLFTNHDRFNTNITPPNHEHSGLTFITRPRLNLSTSSLKQSRILAMLDSEDPYSVKYMIRCLLDTLYAEQNIVAVSKSPLLNFASPWNIPLCNCLTSISGFPDYNIEVETSEGGFHSEDHTHSKGSDRLNKTYDLTLNFKDVLGGTIMSMMHMWMEYMSLLAKNRVTAYQDDIFEQRMNYTVAIYRFIFDPAKTRIVKWAKATGCFPKALPIGACFDINQGETFVSSCSKFSVPFVANKIEYNDPAILTEFNMLTARYNPAITDNIYTNTYGDPIRASNQNFLGFPYIETSKHGDIFLRFKYIKEEYYDPFSEALIAVSQNVVKRKDIQLQQHISEDTDFNPL